MKNQNTKSKLIKLCVDNFQMKGVKRWKGSEGNAINAKLYFRNELFCDYLDEAYGGEDEQRDINENVKIKIKKFFEETNFAQLVFDNGYSFMDEVSAIDFDLMITVVTEYVDHDMQEKAGEKRFMNRFQKDMLTAILAGDPKNITKGYRIWNFKRPISGINPILLQKQIDTIKTKLKAGELILNTNLPETCKP